MLEYLHALDKEGIAYEVKVRFPDESELEGALVRSADSHGLVINGDIEGDILVPWTAVQRVTVWVI